MKLKFAPSLILDSPAARNAASSVPVPFLPHRRVSRTTALWAVAIGIWPVLIYKIFSAGARERECARPANQAAR